MAIRTILSFCRHVKSTLPDKLPLLHRNVCSTNIFKTSNVDHQWKGCKKFHFQSSRFTCSASKLWDKTTKPALTQMVLDGTTGNINQNKSKLLLQSLLNKDARPLSSSSTSAKTESSSTKSPTKGSKVIRPRTKKPSALVPKDESQWLSTAFSMSEEFHLEHLSLDLQTYEPFKVALMPTDAHDVLLMNVVIPGDHKEPSEMFIFRNGCLVFWNVPEPMIKKVMKIAANHQTEPYEVALVNWENEQMNYSYDDETTCLVKDSIVLNGNISPEAMVLEKFAFSNAMVLSVKLAMWEYVLDKFVSSIEHIPEKLKASGKLKMSHKSTMKHMGKLYSLRHRINLSSDLLNTPDFYWDRQELEDLFTKMCQFFSISRRTMVINDKLSHCNDLMDLMRSDVNEQHTLRLEAMITILIAVEIVIELTHYAV